MNDAGLKNLLGYAMPYRATLTAGMLLMLVESGVTLLVPWLGGRLADGMLNGRDATTLTMPILLGLLCVFALQAVLKFANSFLLSRGAERILADLRIRVYDHLQALPLAFYHQHRRGEILALLTNDVPRLSGFISGTLLSVIPLLLILAGAVLLMFRIDAHLAGVVVVLIPLFYLLLKILGRKLRPLASQIQEAHAGALAVAEENMDMLPAIKSFTRERYESERYRQQVDRILRLSTEERRIAAALGPALQFLAAAGIVVVLWMMS
jgi:ATP-binding cassette subfamily B protein